MRLIIKMLTGLLLISIAILVVLFVFKNPQTVTVHFGFATIDNLSVSLWMIAAFTLGGVLGMLAGLPAFILYKGKSKKMERMLNKRTTELQKVKGEMLKG